jgi:exopolysaccharide biosynthesis polyprenyl glycosylphosphotransferase
VARGRTSILPFAAVETAVLLVLVVLIAHSRSFVEQLLVARRAGGLPALAPDEGFYIVARSLLMVLTLQTFFAFRDLYRWSVITRPQLVVVRLVEATGLALVGLPLLHYVFGALDRNLEMKGALGRLQIHPMLVLAAAGACFLAAYGLRMRWPRWARRAGLGERVLLAGRGPCMDVLEEELRRRPDPGIELVGWLDDTNGTPSRRSVIGLPADAATVVRDTGAHRLVVAPGAGIPGDVLLAVRLEDVRVSEAGAFFEQLTGRLPLEVLADPRLLLGPGPGVGLPYVVVRRGLDVLLASVGLLLAAPIGLAVAVAIKLDSRGPVLYRQERVGRNGRTFTLAKFRSMRTDAEAGSGPVWAGTDDPRITRVGRWLRKLRIDEIPQLWSVIRNDMSLVGPRPERAYFVAELERQIPGYGQRHVVKPGVTGWAQINYSYGNSVDDAFIKLQYDLYYVKNRSLALDIAILLRTVKVVVLQQGAV